MGENVNLFLKRFLFCDWGGRLGNANVMPQHRHHHHHHQKRGYHMATTPAAPQPIANHENVSYYDTQVSGLCYEFPLRNWFSGNRKLKCPLTFKRKKKHVFQLQP